MADWREPCYPREQFGSSLELEQRDESQQQCRLAPRLVSALRSVCLRIYRRGFDNFKGAIILRSLGERKHMNSHIA